MHHHEPGSGREFNAEIAVAHGVQRILRDGFKAQEFGGIFAVDGVGGTGKCRRAQGGAVHAVAEIGHTFPVALEHFHVGKKVMPERDGLRHLHVRKARHDRVVFFFGLFHEHFLQVEEALDDFVDFAAKVETHVGRHLVVAAAARMKALAGVADQLREARFDIKVHVFEFKLPLEFAGRDFVADLRHAAADVRQVLRRNDAALFKHGGVCERSVDVRHRHALIKAHGLRVSEHKLADGFGKTAGPRFLFGVQRVVGMIVLCVCHSVLPRAVVSTGRVKNEVRQWGK